MNLVFIGMLVGSYLLGSLNAAIIICKIFKLPSPATVASGNPGATNVLRIGGKIPAALTLVFDILKGFAPVFIASCNHIGIYYIGYIAMAALVGHIYPLFFKFKGGKGVATFIGIIFAYNFVLGFIFVGLWVITAIIGKISSLSALVATVIITIAILYTSNVFISLPFIIMTIIIFIRHAKNIRRIIKGLEPKIGKKKA